MASSDFDIVNGVLKKYRGPGGDVVIQGEVTNIGEAAFIFCGSLTSVTIPSSVTSIGDLAFYDCSSLTSVTIPEGVTSIGDSAFSGCSSLTSVTIPDSVTSIGDSAFSGCSSLTSVTIPSSVTSIGDNAFRDCSSLTSVTIPKGVTSIGDSAFCDCSSLTSVTIPEGVTSIGGWAFYDCSSLTSVTIPDGVTSIGKGAFEGCISLTSVTIPGSVRRICNWAFCGCDSLTSIAIPEGVKVIGEEAFRYCRSLTSVTLPDRMKSIGQGAFKGCKSLTCVTLPHWRADLSFKPKLVCCTEGAISEVPPAYRRAALHGFIIKPDDDLSTERAKSYLDYAKKNAGKLIDLAFENRDVLYFLYEHSLISAKDCAAYVERAIQSGDVEQKALLQDYQNRIGMDTITKEREKKEKAQEAYFDALVERMATRDPSKGIEGMTFVIAGIMREWESQNEVKSYLKRYGAALGRSITKKTDYLVTNEPDGNSANHRIAKEYGVPTLTEAEFNEMIGWRYQDAAKVTIPPWVKEISRRAFYGCRSLTGVTIPESVESIGEEAFEYCMSLTSVTIPEGATSIGKEAFRYCSSLTSITIPDSVTSIGNGAFAFCLGLTIRASAGSAAEAYAKNYRILFEPI